MIGELSVLGEWIPEQMEPGTIFVLENAGEVGERDGGVSPGRPRPFHIGRGFYHPGKIPILQSFSATKKQSSSAYVCFRFRPVSVTIKSHWYRTLKRAN